jgi:hypothetical protein
LSRKYHGAQRIVTSKPVGFSPEIFEQRRHDRDRIGKFFTKESADIVIGFCGGETARAFEFPEERAGEGAVRIRQRNHHETFPRPDVERVFFHLPRTVGSGRDSQFFVAVGQITLVVLKIGDVLLHRFAYGGKCAIDADHGLTLSGSFTGFETSGHRIEIDIDTFVVEVHADGWKSLRRFDHGGVKCRASNRVDALVRVDVVRRKVQFAGFIMDHSAAHWDCVAQCFIRNSNLRECVNPPRGDRKIN